MFSVLASVWGDLTAQDIIRLRFLSMFVVLLGGLSAGYLALNRFGLSEQLARKIMTLVLLALNWPIGLFIIWQMELTSELFWLPVIAVALLFIITFLCRIIFAFHNLDEKSRMTLILAGALSNLGYTGGMFVCYALFGQTGLGLSQIYLVLWVPVVYLTFFPRLRVFELRMKKSEKPGLSIRSMLDYRMLVVPAIIIAIVLNLSGVKRPQFISRFYIVDIFVYVASLLSFFAIGLRITFERLRHYIPLYFSLAAVKFLLTPFVAVLLLVLLDLTDRGLGPMVKSVVIVQSTCPTAVVMVMMSNVFDLDSRLGSALWVVNTAVFTVIVVPVLFIVFV
jgi:predicted permease